MPEKPTHGGARKGAGRPSEGGRKVVTRSFSLSPEGLENIKAKAKEKKCSASALVDDWAKKLKTKNKP